MVTGALAKNRKNKKRINYQNGDKVKILSGENITLEKIYSRYKNGCIVGLENFFKNEKRVLIYSVNFDDKEIEIIVPPAQIYPYKATFKFENIHSNNYVLKGSFEIVSPFETGNNQLEEKLKKIIQN